MELKQLEVTSRHTIYREGCRYCEAKRAKCERCGEKPCFSHAPWRCKHHKWRIYEIGGKKYISVTTILEWFSAKGLSDWRSKNTPDQQEKRSAPARKKGSDLDKLFHQHLRGESVEVPDEYKPAWERFLAMVDRHQVKSLVQNYVVYHPGLGFAGELDDLAYLGPDLAVIDWKTGRKYNSVELQMAAYRWALLKTHEIEEKVGTACGLVKADGTFAKMYITERLDITTHTFAAVFDMMAYDTYYDRLGTDLEWIGSEFATDVLAREKV